MKYNILVASPNPRDIPDFYEAMSNLDFDRFYAKYYRCVDAYPRIRDFFLGHDYDILCLFSDDLIVNPLGLRLLIDDIIRYPGDVISGYCNFDMNRYSDKYCFLKEGNTYYPEINKLDEYLKDARTKYQPHLYHVTFNGFACIVIHRNILEKIPFRFSDNGGGVDQNFCDDCRERGIDVLVDIREPCRFLHLADRLKNGMLENCGIGIKQPFMSYIPVLSSPGEGRAIFELEPKAKA